MSNNLTSHPASFRDPAGRILIEGNDTIIREITGIGVKSYHKLKESGLYDEFVKKSFIVSHEEREVGEGRVVIQPEFIKNISYPYEWSFSQLKDAALLTLEMQKKCLENGMCLKDASAFNVQFKDDKPIFIDTSSIDLYEEGTPWVAYKQFCQHFLAPLALMSYTDMRLINLLKIYIDGIPLDLTKNLLPSRCRFKLGLYMHIYLHSKMQSRYAAAGESQPKVKKLSKTSLLGIIDSLESNIKSLGLKSDETEWGDYYNNTNYQEDAFKEKQKLVKELGAKVSPKSVWDLGANEGVFSRLFSEQGIDTVAWDIDPIAVEKNYLRIKNKNEKNLYPRVLDLTNPSAGLGWDNLERHSFFERARDVDLVTALALIHHLAISNNVPMEMVAQTFARVGKYLIIEFVPKSDSQVKILLSSRVDIFENYTFEGFENSFSKYFDILDVQPVKNSERKIYLMKRK